MYNIIVNPIAGKNRAKKNIKKIAKYLKSQQIPFLVYFSECENDIYNIAKKLTASGEKDFIIVGGTTSIHEFINGATNLNKINLGIIPSGKYNNFAKNLGLNFNSIKALKDILSGNIEKVDTLTCNNIKCVNDIIIGNIADCSKKLESQKFPNPLSRKINYLKNIKSYEGIVLNIESTDLKEKEKLLSTCVFSNGDLAFKNYSLAPLSNLQDGLINLVTIDYLDKKHRIKTDFKIKKGKHNFSNYSTNSWTSYGKISTPDQDEINIMIDDKFYSLKNININISPECLNIYKQKN